MKGISIQINYDTQWGQFLQIGFSNEYNGEIIEMKCIAPSIWQAYFEVLDDLTHLKFKFFVLENNNIIREEDGLLHIIILSTSQTEARCIWQDKPKQSYFETSIFSNSLFKHKVDKFIEPAANQTQLIVACLHVEPSQELVLSGNSILLGEWNEKKAISLEPISYGKWHIALDNNLEMNNCNYKFAIRDKASKKIVEWEDGVNRTFDYSSNRNSTTIELQYRKQWIDWKAAGVAIPIFSLRSENSFGIGEFSDLPLLTDWAADAKLKVIQILPINDTTATYSWIDSYPYNAISIYALHPIYLGLYQLPLKNKAKDKQYKAIAKELNNKSTVDYTAVIALKTEYIKELYKEIGESTLNTKAYKNFYKQNEHWLFPYACFSYLRDKYKTTCIADWGEYRRYDITKLEALVKSDSVASESICQVYFTQYLLHKQLSEAKNYAYTKGLALKGDIPIGISPNSVEAWTEPYLFNLDSQTGAPPDDFSVKGQNWGFPTYNWKEMEKDGYQWWIKRFRKMADYFDAYRIDHILGFFRIWEIPKTSVEGLLGYFSPALPLSISEIQSWGVVFDKQMTIAAIHKDDLAVVFGEYSHEVENKYLNKNNEEWYSLKEECNNQAKIRELFLKKESEKDRKIKDGLYATCNEVLFIQDKYDSSKFHPRISIQQTLRYKHLDTSAQDKLYRLYENFFYHRHTQFWKNEAMRKLPSLIEATNMLVCGEDLGMVPQSVASVMNDLQILSLEIERMPKHLGIEFEDLQHLPYLSVTTTSTHDMSPLRLWWTEDKERTQNYFRKVLGWQSQAPCNCNTIISQIIREHLRSPAMLAIIPLQDWLAMSDKLQRKNPEEERINEPSNPHHNWNYRMHITLEKLIEEKDFVHTMRFLIEESGR